MKTAISMPDEVFDRVTQVARRNGMNRSQFFATAALRYADELESLALTAAIDAAVDLVPADDATDFARRAGHRTLSASDDSW